MRVTYTNQTQMENTSSCEVRMFALKVVVRTDLLHKLVVDAKEGDEDADDFEGFGAEPG